MHIQHFQIQHTPLVAVPAVDIVAAFEVVVHFPSAAVELVAYSGTGHCSFW